MKKRIIMGLCLLWIVLSGCGEASRSYFEEASEAAEESAETEQAAYTYETEEDTEYYVYVCGAVQQPGVYKLPAGSRIYEAVSMAGGLLEGACEDNINQAEEIADGQMIKVLTVEEAADQKPKAQTDMQAADGKVNINTAGADELTALPGIGAAKAESILSYREEKGRFSSIEEIMNITGIKEGVYSKIKDYITVN